MVRTLKDGFYVIMQSRSGRPMKKIVIVGYYIKRVTLILILLIVCTACSSYKTTNGDFYEFKLKNNVPLEKIDYEDERFSHYDYYRINDSSLEIMKFNSDLDQTSLEDKIQRSMSNLHFTMKDVKDSNNERYAVIYAPSDSVYEQKRTEKALIILSKLDDEYCLCYYLELDNNNIIEDLLASFTVK